MSVAVSPQSAARIPALDALRALGAIGILLTHVSFATGASLNGYWGGLLARLDVQVAVFFVLSGFLLFRPFAHAVATGGQRPWVTQFFWRRAVRILPAYWITIVLCVTLLPQNANMSVHEAVHFT